MVAARIGTPTRRISRTTLYKSNARRAHGTGRVPAFWLAVWLFRNMKWPKNAAVKDVISRLTEQFFLTRKELEQLFQLSPPDIPDLFLTTVPFDDTALLRHVEPAPDATPDEGGTLRLLSLVGVGPSLGWTLVQPSDCQSLLATTAWAKRSSSNVRGGVSLAHGPSALRCPICTMSSDHPASLSRLPGRTAASLPREGRFNTTGIVTVGMNLRGGQLCPVW